MHLLLTTKVAFDGHVRVDVFPDREHFGIGQVIDPASFVDLHSIADLLGDMRTDAMDIGESNGNPLCSRDVHAGDTSHVSASFRCGSVVPEPFFTTLART